jgi:hypothetical protein
MSLSRTLTLRLLKRQDWGRTPATPRLRRSALSASRHRSTTPKDTQRSSR